MTSKIIMILDYPSLLKANNKKHFIPIYPIRTKVHLNGGSRKQTHIISNIFVQTSYTHRRLGCLREQQDKVQIH